MNTLETTFVLFAAIVPAVSLVFLARLITLALDSQVLVSRAMAASSATR